MLTDLHAPIEQLLRHQLSHTALPRQGRVLDLASGSGLKVPLLAAACGPEVQFIALDWIESLVQLAAAHPHTLGITANAEALPLQDGRCDAAVCIAALGLFEQPDTVLCEVRRVLRPGGTLLIVTATQLWAEVWHYPAAVTAAYTRMLESGGPPLPAVPDIGEEIHNQLVRAGFGAPHIRAFRLDALEADSCSAEVALLPWATLAPALTAYLAPATLAACATTTPEIELHPIATLTTAHA